MTRRRPRAAARGFAVALASMVLVSAFLNCHRQRDGSRLPDRPNVGSPTATDRDVGITKITSAELVSAEQADAASATPSESPEHTRAMATGLEHANAQVAKGNAAHNWESKGADCDPRNLEPSKPGVGLEEPPGIAGCPPGMAPVPARRGVCIDRWEAHLVAPLTDGTEQTWSPYSNPGSVLVRAKSVPLAVPQGYISQVQAAGACAAANKSLCSDADWIAACRGSWRTTFPYGNVERPGACNDHRRLHPAAQYLESRSVAVYDKLQHPCINQLLDSLLPTGTKAECVSPEGIFDMVGNVHEWTASAQGTFRGGYYVDTQLNGPGCDYVTVAHDATYWDFSTGFRCCAFIGT